MLSISVSQDHHLIKIQYIIISNRTSDGKHAHHLTFFKLKKNLHCKCKFYIQQPQQKTTTKKLQIQQKKKKQNY